MRYVKYSCCCNQGTVSASDPPQCVAFGPLFFFVTQHSDVFAPSPSDVEELSFNQTQRDVFDPKKKRNSKGRINDKINLAPIQCALVIQLSLEK